MSLPVILVKLYNIYMADDDLLDMEEIEQIAAELDDGDGVHLVPAGDIAPHTKAPNCHCQPRRIFRDGKRNVEIWLHPFLKEVIN